METTLALDQKTWDLTLDSNGNISMFDDDLAVAQNVANAVRLFTNDAYFQQEDGVNHFSLDLGKNPSESLLRSRINEAALRVSGVTTAETQLSEYTNRSLKGKILITTTKGTKVNVSF